VSAALTIARDYCRGCKGTSRQRFAGWATGDGRENGVRPRAFYRECERCSTHRLVLQNVTDAEGLCRTVLRGWLAAHATDARVTSLERPFGDGALDAEDALGFLQGEVWKLYTEWIPERSEGSFLAYATALLPRRLATWSRDASGEASTRAKGRRFPKAHAASVSVSLDGLTAGDEQEDGREQSGHDFLSGGGSDGGAATDAETGALDLLRAITTAGGGTARGQRGAGGADARRASGAGRGG
jgi:hypothetical protein